MEATTRRIEAALQAATNLLGSERQPKHPSQVHHTYKDKFALAELATQAALAGLHSVLDHLTGQFSQDLPWLAEQATTRSVSVRLACRERCALQGKEERVLDEAKTNSTWLDDTLQWLAVTGSSKTVIREDIWRVDVDWELMVYAGSNPEDTGACRIYERGTGWRQIRTISTHEKTPPRPAVAVPPPLEAEITWLIRRLASPSPCFSIDRSLPSCRTPSRNVDVEAAARQLCVLEQWAGSVRAWLQDSILTGSATRGGIGSCIERLAQPFTFTDSDGDINRLAMDGNRLVWYEPNAAGGWQPWAVGPFRFDMSTGEIEGRTVTGGSGRAVVLQVDRRRLLRCAFGGSLQLADVDAVGDVALEVVLCTFALEGRESGATTFSSEDLQQLSAEYTRNVSARSTTLAQAFPEDRGQLPAARLATCAQHLHCLAIQHAAAVAAIEDMLYRQLIAALGKEIGPTDFDELTRWHQRQALCPGCRPCAFSYPIQLPGMCAEGHVSIRDQRGQELQTFTMRRPALVATKLPIAASVDVRLMGERFVHGALLPCFAEPPRALELEARLRHFGCAVLVLGTVSAADTFLPSAALVLRGSEAAVVPLLLEALPTAKEFKDATASLSPEQKKFAQAIRAMQLASTVFGICVIPVKPQLEKLLGLPRCALAQEVKLTEDLLELMLKYQVPSSLLRYNGPQEAGPEARLAAVRSDVGALRAMIQAEKEKELKEAAEKKRLELLEKRRQAAARAAAAASVSNPARSRMAAGEQCNSLVKVILWGPEGCGKSCLLTRLVDGTFSGERLPTIGVEFKTEPFEVGQHLVKAQIWDTSGQERFSVITRTYLRGTHCLILVFDLSDPESLDKLERMYREAQEHMADEVAVVLVGAKADEPQAYSSERIDNFRRTFHAGGMPYFETSARWDPADLMPAFQRVVCLAQSTRTTMAQLDAARPAMICCASPEKQSRSMSFGMGSIMQSVSDGAASVVGAMQQPWGFAQVKYCSYSASNCSVEMESLERVLPRGGDLSEITTRASNLSASAGEAPLPPGPAAIEAPEAPTSGLAVEPAPSGSGQQHGTAGEAREQEPHTPTPTPSSVKEHGEARAQQNRDCTQIPALLDQKAEQLGQGAALRPVIIKAAAEWRKRTKNLLGIEKESSLGAKEQVEERNAAFDLLDALSCSGSLVVDEASLHVVFLMAHCFDDALLDLLVQQSVNPIVPVERSSLILASTILDRPARCLLRPEELPRVAEHSPALVEQGRLQE